MNPCADSITKSRIISLLGIVGIDERTDGQETQSRLIQSSEIIRENALSTFPQISGNCSSHFTIVNFSNKNEIKKLADVITRNK